MSLPAETTPAQHVYVPDALTRGDTCQTCGFPEPFGALHIEPEPVPDSSPWKPGDILRNPVTGGIFAVRQRYGVLEFLELYPTASQDNAPVNAELLVRNGEAVCRCLGCGDGR